MRDAPPPSPTPQAEFAMFDGDYRGDNVGAAGARVSWDSICSLRSGGLGLRDLHHWNMACMVSLIHSLLARYGSICVAWADAYVLRGLLFGNFRPSLLSNGLAWNAYFYFVWKERNCRIFQSISRDLSSIVLDIKGVVQLRLHGRFVKFRMDSINSLLCYKWGIHV
ncbi:hypothetical protein GQ457_03G037020 [Hibiscus cannabinus]